MGKFRGRLGKFRKWYSGSMSIFRQFAKNQLINRVTLSFNKNVWAEGNLTQVRQK